MFYFEHYEVVEHFAGKFLIVNVHVCFTTLSLKENLLTNM